MHELVRLAAERLDERIREAGSEFPPVGQLKASARMLSEKGTLAYRLVLNGDEKDDIVRTALDAALAACVAVLSIRETQLHDCENRTDTDCANAPCEDCPIPAYQKGAGA